MSGQSILDRMTAAKHSIAGQGLAKTVCKATTEEVMGPKKKHLDYLLQCTNEPNVSIPQLADLLIERTQNTSWVIVFKALISMHNLMNYGNERFTQYLASNNCTVNLASFIDKTGVQGYDMSTFIRRYSKYFNEKAYSYRTMAYDFCKVKRGREDGLLRTMSSEKLLKALPVLQRQIDALLEFDCSANELTNGVINAAFMLLFKDLIRLFACYNDGVINLLEKYFDMNKKNCKEALDIYKKFLVRMDKVSEFLRVAENVGIDKGDIPDLAKGLRGNSVSAPASLLDALEQHMLSLEGKKGTTISNKPSSTVSSAISNLANNSPNIQITEEEKRKILDEENARLQQLKEQKAQDTTTIKPAQTTTNNPFVVSEPPTNDIAAQKPSDDLVNLAGNPFIESVQTMMQAQNAQNAFGAPTWGAPAQTEPGMGGGGFADSNFANFSNVNGTTGGTTMAQPRSWTPTITAEPGFDAFGEVMQPQNTGQPKATKQTEQSVANTDLDSMMTLAGNLTMNGASQVKKQQHQWQPTGEKKKTGGDSWGPTQLSQGMTWSQPVPQPQMTGMMYGAPAAGMGAQPMMNPAMGAPGGMPGMAPMGMQPMGAPVPMGQPMYGGMRPGMAPAGMAMGQPRPPSAQPNDPFGAL